MWFYTNVFRIFKVHFHRVNLSCWILLAFLQDRCIPHQNSQWLFCSRVCVCVKHLNRCKTSHQYFQSRGMVGILGVTTQRRHSKFAVICNLDADCTYLHLRHSNRPSSEPDETIFWLFGSLLTHFSPFQIAELWMHYFDLGSILPFTLTSWVFRCLLRRGLLGIYD